MPTSPSRLQLVHTNVPVVLGDALTTTVSDDGWDRIGPQHIAYWEEAKGLLSQRRIEHRGMVIDVAVDWAPVVRRLKRDHRRTAALYAAKTKEELDDAFGKFPRSPVRVDFEVVADHGGQEPPQSHIYRSFVEYFLYDFFTTMNIASPASCNFYSTKILSHNLRRELSTDIRLSSSNFEVALIPLAGMGWPKVEMISLSDTNDWYREVRPGVAMVPSNRMDRVLFALLHIAQSDLSPMTVIWIFYALESLFDTKVGENYRALLSRISLLLDASPRDFKYLRKSLRELYDFRSGLVHGGAEVIHPMHNELLDRSMDDVYHRLMRSVDFGFQILVASIQETIRRGWREPTFSEVLL